MKLIIALIICAFASICSAQMELVHHNAYSVWYDHAGHIPKFVSYIWTPENAVENCKRPNTFNPDPNLNSPPAKDFSLEGYHRAHMCDAESRQNDPELMKETFYTSNIILEKAPVNIGVDKASENYPRKNPARYLIIAGTIYDDNSQRFNNIIIPDRKYRVAINLDTGEVHKDIFDNK